ncbi:MAG: class II SORL domain-containing protein [bacterium]
MEVQRAKNPNDLSDTEKMHIPFIEIPYPPIKGDIFELIVRVGEIMHPMSEEHFIEWIELYNDNILLDKVELGPDVEPKCIFNISMLKNINFKIIASCNLHGVWEKSARIQFSLIENGLEGVNVFK